MHPIDLDTHKKLMELEAQVATLKSRHLELEKVVEAIAELAESLQKLIEKHIEVPFEEGRND